MLPSLTAAPLVLGVDALPDGPVPPAEGEPPHLWLLRVSDYRAGPGAVPAVLDPDERRRHAAFVRAADRERYATAHLGLRRLLGGYLGTEPGAVTLVREACPLCGGAHGRPAVRGSGLHFSLSHSHDLVLLAFAAVPVGVDVEKVPAPTAVDEVSASLHPREQAELGALPPPARAAAFTRCWARTEAYLKGTGEGLAGGVGSAYIGTGPEPAAVPGWSLADIAVDPGYRAAVAVALGI